MPILCDWVYPAMCILWGAEHHGAALTSSSISTACSSPHQMPALLHKVEEERCRSLNRIYGLSVRHKLESKCITEELASSTATCLYCCCDKITTTGLLQEAAHLPTWHVQFNGTPVHNLRNGSRLITVTYLRIFNNENKQVLRKLMDKN